MRKDGSDHKHEFQAVAARLGDKVIHHCPKCGLKSRKGETQHDNFKRSK